MTKSLEQWITAGLILLATHGMALLIGIVWANGHHKTADLRTELTATRAVVQTERKQEGVSQSVSAKAETDKAKVRTVTKTLIEKVNVYVPQTNDPGDYLSNGFVRLHDAAVEGVSSLPDAPGEFDADASPFTKTDAAFALAWNYGIAHECTVTLTGLQDWAKAQHDLSAKTFAK